MQATATFDILTPARVALLAFSCVLAVLAARPAHADSQGKLSFNAYLTAAYGETDGVPAFGLTESGTFDYYSGAMLFSHQISEDDKVVIQLATESLGESALDELRDEIELDWVFYEHRFPAGTSVRVGRVPIPFGIYNELRDVGILLPFYRPPVGIYFEGAFSSETVDGVVLSHRFFPSSDWAFEAEVYAGEWERAEYIAPTIAEGRAKDALGLQLWLETPVPGLRFGLAGQRFDYSGGIEFVRPEGQVDRFETLLFSVEADFSRFYVRGEVQQIETQFFGLGDVEIPAFYIMAGVRLSEKLEINVMYEDSTSKIDSPFGGLEIDPFFEDLAASLVYRFSPKTLLRLELHQLDTNSADIATPIGESSLRSDFGILSVSVAF